MTPQLQGHFRELSVFVLCGVIKDVTHTYKYYACVSGLFLLIVFLFVCAEFVCVCVVGAAWQI